MLTYQLLSKQARCMRVGLIFCSILIFVLVGLLAELPDWVSMREHDEAYNFKGSLVRVTSGLGDKEGMLYVDLRDQYCEAPATPKDHAACEIFTSLTEAKESYVWTVGVACVFVASSILMLCFKLCLYRCTLFHFAALAVPVMLFPLAMYLYDHQVNMTFGTICTRIVTEDETAGQLCAEIGVRLGLALSFAVALFNLFQIIAEVIILLIAKDRNNDLGLAAKYSPAYNPS